MNRHAIVSTRIGDLTLVVSDDAPASAVGAPVGADGAPVGADGARVVADGARVSAVGAPVSADGAHVRPEGALVGVYFPHHWVKPAVETLGDRVDVSDPLIAVVVVQLEEYFRSARVSFDLPTRLQGDEFQRRVWTVLQEIPYGGTTTYGEIAERLGQSAQAVGKAVGQNPLSIVVPCHRVIGKNGSLTGYAGGLKRKQFLLDLEQPADARLF